MLNIFKKKCSICGKKYDGYGNNARPVNDGKCCDYCNANVVIPARIYQWKERQWSNGRRRKNNSYIKSK